MSTTTEYKISGLPEGKDLTTCSKEDLEKMKVEKTDNEISTEEYDFSDGKDREKKKETQKKIKELETLLGVPQMNPYKTLNTGIFKEFLSTASVSELTDLALRVGVTPNRTPALLRKGLLASFGMYVQKHDVTVGGQMQPLIDRSSPEYNKVVKMFGDY
jgi:hypothetical protein|tara:strand:- start:1034 stop:1510 length:477 start_codon:yes stop_codon:yes gene_type:complete